MAGPTLEVMGIISEFAAGGALAAIALRFTVDALRKLPPFAKPEERPGFVKPGVPLERDTEGLSDAKFLGEAFLGALAAGLGASVYFGALPKGNMVSLELAVFTFIPAAWAVIELRREPMPGEPAVDDEKSLKAWMGFGLAFVPLLTAAAKYYY